MGSVTSQELDGLVYELYGLRGEEIAIVEGAGSLRIPNARITPNEGSVIFESRWPQWFRPGPQGAFRRPTQTRKGTCGHTSIRLRQQALPAPLSGVRL